LGTENQVYASERDFVAKFLLPKLTEAADRLGFHNVIDFYVEKSVDGTPDLSAEKGGRGLFIVEAKFKKKGPRGERDIEPLDPIVVEQAVRYAGMGGFPYFTTCNTKRLVLFQPRPTTRAIECVITTLDYERNPDWAEILLKTSLELVPVQLKALDDTLVDELHDAFSDLYSEFSLALRKKLLDQKFRNRYDEWLESQGIKRSDEENRLIAEQTTYLQLNKLLFYQVIRAIYPDRLKPLKVDEDRDVQETLSEFYQDALEIDYTPIYQSDIMSEIPLTPRAEERIRTLLDTLNEFDFSTMESDFIGRFYEKLIPPAERKRLGQFYTPPGIVDLIVNLTITEPDDVVLDPGCGSGSFLVRAYHRLCELNDIPKRVPEPMGETYHRQILEQLYGVDINQFPAHLTVINLAVQNPKAQIRKINTIVGDFFDVKPGAHTLFGFKSITAEGEETAIYMPQSFNVVVANPPYIEQELLGEKEKVKIKDLIEGEYKAKLFIGTSPRKIKGSVVLSRQSDIYVYFFIHGLKFLKNGGRLGFISSNKWLEVEYGEPFQKFLLANARILQIIEFDRAVFPDAQVNTAVTIIEKETDGRKRSRNLAKFIRIKKRTDPKTQLRLIQEANESFEDEFMRVDVVNQEDLVEGKWNIHLRGPLILQRIVAGKKMKPLAEVARVFRGPTTGCDEFFVLGRERLRNWKIESGFLTPYISSPKQLRALVTRKEEVKDFLFTTDAPKSALRGTGAIDYVEHGEKLEVEPRKGFERKKRRIPELETLKARRLWYSLPKVEVPPILMTKMMDKRPKAIWNLAKAHASNLFYYVIPNHREDELVLLGFLNSSLGAFLAEIYGRSYGGGVLELAAYELKRIPVLNHSTLSKEESDKIAGLFKALVGVDSERIEIEYRVERAERGAEGKKGSIDTKLRMELDKANKAEEETRRKLDEVIYDILGLTKEECSQFEEDLKELQELRRLRTQA
jgi:type I restriction-modification system DNA methylase subunit